MSAGAGARKSLAIISLTNGIAISIETHLGDQVKAMTDDICMHCKHCFDAWDDTLSKENIQQIDKCLQATESVVIQAGSGTAALTSLALAILSDLYDEIKKSKKKRYYVSNLLESVTRLHYAFDQDLDHWQDYDAASLAVKELHKTGV